jgi:hypothetical protein
MADTVVNAVDAKQEEFEKVAEFFQLAGARRVALISLVTDYLGGDNGLLCLAACADGFDGEVTLARDFLEFVKGTTINLHFPDDVAWFAVNGRVAKITLVLGATGEKWNR